MGIDMTRRKNAIVKLTNVVQLYVSLVIRTSPLLVVFDWGVICLSIGEVGYTDTLQYTRQNVRGWLS